MTRTITCVVDQADATSGNKLWCVQGSTMRHAAPGFAMAMGSCGAWSSDSRVASFTFAHCSYHAYAASKGRLELSSLVHVGVPHVAVGYHVRMPAQTHGHTCPMWCDASAWRFDLKSLLCQNLITPCILRAGGSSLLIGTLVYKTGVHKRTH